MLCPSSPTLGQLWNRKQARHLISIARIDAKDISDGEVVIRLLHDPDFVSGADIALDHDAGRDLGDDAAQACRAAERLVGVAYAEGGSTGIAPNNLTAAGDRDPFVGTPWHKHVPARLERV